MAQITAQMVKQLREMTGTGPLDCKKALEMHDGDVDKAVAYLREKGLSKAAKKLGAGRSMAEGLVGMYHHFDQRMAAIVEVNCETDFVAKTDTFQTFARDLAIHVASLNPQYITIEDVPEDVVAAERDMQIRILREDEKNAGKPDAILEKIVEGRMSKFYEEIVLMEQVFIKDDKKKVKDLLSEAVAELGESIQISRMARFAIGEGDGGDEDEE